MLKLITSLFFISSVAVAANQPEVGVYSAVDLESGTIQATITIRADQTLNFGVVTPDFTMPEPGCEGNFAVNDQSILSVALTCPIEALPNVNVNIDLTNATPEAVRSEQGALVAVVLDVVGPEAISFVLKKIK